MSLKMTKGKEIDSLSVDYVSGESKEISTGVVFEYVEKDSGEIDLSMDFVNLELDQIESALYGIEQIIEQLKVLPIENEEE